jgi:hypothetical protein
MATKVRAARSGSKSKIQRVAKARTVKVKSAKAKTGKSQISPPNLRTSKGAAVKPVRPEKPRKRPAKAKILGPGMDGTTSLLVIGSGFGRTGTKSLKVALEQLGFGPCHHMHENIERPELVSHWQNVAAGKPVDWKEVFAGYRSQVDWPGAHVWRELSAAFPDAKVIHSVRPEDVWWNSFSKTIGKLGITYQQMQLPPHIRNMTDAAFEMIGKQTFDGKMADRNAALAVYNLRTRQVREAIPPERLLVFDVAEGWEPLCRFLNVPVPNRPFPHLNLRADFWEALGGEPA